MRELLLALMTWIAGQTGLAMPPPPSVVLISEEEIAKIAAGHEGADVRGLYDRDVAIIYLRNDWNPDDLRSRASLLHELVHHAQTFNKVPSRCPAEREVQAYRLTVQWLKEQGAADPYALLDIDEFTIHVLSMCPES